MHAQPTPGAIMFGTTGTHYFFITNQDEVVRIMREYLAAVLPR